MKMAGDQFERIRGQNGVDEYKTCLVSENSEVTGFCPGYPDDFIRTLRSINKTEWTKELEERYSGIKEII